MSCHQAAPAFWPSFLVAYLFLLHVGSESKSAGCRPGEVFFVSAHTTRKRQPPSCVMQLPLLQSLVSVVNAMTPPMCTWHWQVMAQLRQEQRDVVREFGTDMSPEAVRSMKYTEAMMRESLRLRSTVPGTGFLVFKL